MHLLISSLTNSNIFCKLSNINCTTKIMHKYIMYKNEFYGIFTMGIIIGFGWTTNTIYIIRCFFDISNVNVRKCYLRNIFYFFFCNIYNLYIAQWVKLIWRHILCSNLSPYSLVFSQMSFDWFLLNSLSLSELTSFYPITRFMKKNIIDNTINNK